MYLDIVWFSFNFVNQHSAPFCEVKFGSTKLLTVFVNEVKGKQHNVKACFCGSLFLKPFFQPYLFNNRCFLTQSAQTEGDLSLQPISRESGFLPKYLYMYMQLTLV